MAFGIVLIGVSSYGLYYISNTNVTSELKLLNTVLIIGVISGIVCFIDSLLLFSSTWNNKKFCFFLGALLVLFFSLLFIATGVVLIKYGSTLNSKVLNAKCVKSTSKVENLMYRLNLIYAKAQNSSGTSGYCASSSCHCALSDKQVKEITNTTNYSGKLFVNGTVKTLSGCKTL